MVRTLMPFLILTFLLASARVSAQDVAPVSYSHHVNCSKQSDSKNKCTLHERRRVKPGETIRVEVTDTDTMEFSLDIHGYDSIPQRVRGATYKASGQPTGVLEKEFTHNERYGGYVVSIVPKSAT